MAQTTNTTNACELRRNLKTAVFGAVLLMFFLPALASASALNAAELRRDLAEAGYAREGGQAQTPAPSAPLASEAHAPDDAQQAEGEHAAEHSIGEMILGMGWPVANFIIFVGILYYLLNQPIREYLATRDATIRKDLVEAAELRATATAQLEAIEKKVQALPGELAALRTRGAEDIKVEEQRIAAQAAADRDRLLEQTRREIALQVRLAKKEILVHAANLSVQLATDRIRTEVTPADQDRLIDRYLSQVKEQQ